eukprot:2363911-Amphidinium_carterae.1
MSPQTTSRYVHFYLARPCARDWNSPSQWVHLLQCPVESLEFCVVSINCIKVRLKLLHSFLQF